MHNFDAGDRQERTSSEDPVPEYHSLSTPAPIARAGRYASDSRHAPMSAEVEPESDQMLVAGLSLVMCVGMFATGLGVYAEGRLFEHHQYVFVVWYPIVCVAVYGAACALHGPSRRLLAQEWRKVRVYAPIGAMWSVNYAFILTANTYTSNLFQVIFTQSQLVLTFAMNTYLTDAQFAPQHLPIIVAIVLFNLLLVGNTVHAEGSVAWALFWEFLFFLNGAAASLANVFTEAYFKSNDVHHDDYVLRGTQSPGDVGVRFADEPRPPAPDERGDEFRAELSKTLVLNFLTNLYAALGNLALLYVTYPIEGGISAAQLWNDHLWSSDSWAYYLMCVGTIVYTVSTTILFRYTNVTFTSVLGAISNTAQVVLVSLPVVGADLQQVFTRTEYMIYGSCACLSVMYAFFQYRESRKTLGENSILVRFYRDEASKSESRRINAVLGGFFLLVVAVTLPLSLLVKQ